MRFGFASLVICTATCFLVGGAPAYASTHFFTDGSIADDFELAFGIFQHEGNLFGDFTTYPVRLEFAVGDKVSLFGQGEIIEVDSIFGSNSSYGIGFGGMFKVHEDNKALPLDISVLSSGMYYFEDLNSDAVGIESWTTIEASAIASKSLKKQINFDLTPYGSVNGSFHISDDDTDNSFTLGLGARARFGERFSVSAEFDIGDAEGWGLGGSVLF